MPIFFPPGDTSGGGGGGSALTVKSKGVTLDSAVTSIDFIGGAVGTNASHAVTIEIAGAQYGTSGARPAAAPANDRELWYSTDLGLLYISNGSVWTTVVVDHGTGLSGLSDDDHPQYVLRSIATTKGDLLVRDASALVRKAVGSNDLPLVADSSDATGVSWKALPITGGGTGATAAGTARFNLHDQMLAAARAASTSNVASKSGTTTIDGVSLIANEVVLLTGQTAPAENGPWRINAGAWTRPDDYPAGGQVLNRVINVTGGTLNKGQWSITIATAITVDTTSTTWVKNNGNDALAAGTLINLDTSTPGITVINSSPHTVAALYTVAGSPYTINDPGSACKSITVELQGAGAGGSAGRQGAASSDRYPGNGGGVGGRRFYTFLYADIAAWPVTLTIGAGGTAGVATAAGTAADGGAGGAGGATSFGTNLSAGGAAATQGGSTAQPVQIPSNTTESDFVSMIVISTLFVPPAGALMTTAALAGAGPNGNTGSAGSLPGSGACGGAVTAANVERAGGTGGAGYPGPAGTGNPGGTGGAVRTNAGAATATPLGHGGGGGGGGGGGSSSTTVKAGNGSAGANFGAGGGGGGAGTSTGTAKAGDGGAGAPGYALLSFNF